MCEGCFLYDSSVLFAYSRARVLRFARWAVRMDPQVAALPLQGNRPRNLHQTAGATHECVPRSVLLRRRRAAGARALLLSFLTTFGAVVLIAYLISVVGMWRVYEKAGKPGWASLIPIYNYLVLVEIVGRPIWWFFLLFIPGVNAVIGVILLWDLNRSFGQSTGFFLGLVFLSAIFFPILGFGSARYLGPAASPQGLRG